MTEEQQAQASDSSQPTPQGAGEDTLQFEIADSSGSEPTAEGQEAVAPEPQERYLGDYETREAAEQGLAETKRAMHEKAEEAAAYRKALEALQGQTPAPPPQYGGQPDMERLNDQFRGQLEQDPWNTMTAFMRNVIQEERTAEQQAQSQVMGEYQKFASDPAYADVAPQVMQSLPFHQGAPDIEKEFLRAKLQHMQSNATNQQVSEAAKTQRMHVESGASTSPSNVMRIEVEPDARRVQQAFHDDEKTFIETNKVSAAIKDMGLGGKNPVGIEQYREARRKAGLSNG